MKIQSIWRIMKMFIMVAFFFGEEKNAFFLKAVVTSQEGRCVQNQIRPPRCHKWNLCTVLQRKTSQTWDSQHVWNSAKTKTLPVKNIGSLVQSQPLFKTKLGKYLCPRQKKDSYEENSVLLYQQRKSKLTDKHTLWTHRKMKKQWHSN